MRVADPCLWTDPKSAQSTIQDLKLLRSIVDPYLTLKKQIIDDIDLMNISDELVDIDLISDVGNYVDGYGKRLQELEVKAFFANSEDSHNALLSIHAGAGGIDAMDWAARLERMYQRWFDKVGFELEIIERATSDVGIKRLVMEVRGLYAYGYLKSEIGVHRICHISEFDANHKKQTSFASVDVVPIYEKINVEIKESDLEVETMRSQGPGGQGVQTTDSAVRVRHKPSGLFVKCQSSRSQMQNKKKAILLLASRLQDLEDKRDVIVKPNISFGNQIRSYVIEPYQMITDHRSEYKTSDVAGVLNGNLTPIIEAYLRTASKI